MSNNPKILIADDEQFVTDFLKDLLAASGFQALAAVNGKEAINAVSSEHPDLILLDITMPDMDGFEVCKAMRGKAENSSMPIIMLTGDANESAIVQALEHGADDYITKPFKNDELIEKIRHLLSEAEKKSLPSQLHSKNPKDKEK